MADRLARLERLRTKAENAATELLEAEERIGRAREEARAAIMDHAALEAEAIGNPNVDADEVERRGKRRSEAIAALRAIETDLAG